MPPWLRMTLIGGTMIGVVALLMWEFVLPPTRDVTANARSDWSAGTSMSLPDETPAPPAKPASVPGPGTPSPVQSVTPGVHRMLAWGAEGSNSMVQKAARAMEGRGDGPADPGAGGASGGTPAAGDYGSRLVSTPTRESEAEVDKDISLLLAETTSFGCLPNSPIDTQLVGGVSCTVDENVWSADGSTILIDRLAMVSGEIQRGLENGQDRAFILWRSVRSKRVHAILNSPATDQLGQMGAPGEVNDHLWKKLKATLLLTAVEGLSGTAQSLAARSNNSVTNNFQFNNGTSLAQTMLQHDINIPSTLWRGQAWPLRVYVQHDIQFRRAYNNVLTAGAR
jgi:type IV secretion system protein VirB10